MDQSLSDIRGECTVTCLSVERDGITRTTDWLGVSDGNTGVN